MLDTTWSSPTIAPLTYRLLGMGDIDFSLAATNIFARTATVIVDFGLGTTPIQVRVATVLDRDNPGVALPTVLSDVMNLPVMVGTSPWEFGHDRTPGNTFSGISSVRGLAASGPDTSYWVLTHTRNEQGGGGRVTDVYNPVVEAYDPATITVRMGSVLGSAQATVTDASALDMTWHLWTGVVENLGNGQSTVRLYRDGALAASTTVSGTSTPSARCRFDVGNTADGDDCMSQDAQPGKRSYGQVDDLRIYQRALTSGEVSLLFATTPSCS